MESIVLQPQLMKQVVLVASQESTNPDELVETAVRDYLRALQRRKIEAEAQAFGSMHTELVKPMWRVYYDRHGLAKLWSPSRLLRHDLFRRLQQLCRPLGRHALNLKKTG